MSSHTTSGPLAAAAGSITIGGDLTVNRMGFGAMRLTGRGIWGPPTDRPEAIRVLRRAIELGVDFIDRRCIPILKGWSSPPRAGLSGPAPISGSRTVGRII